MKPKSAEKPVKSFEYLYEIRYMRVPEAMNSAAKSAEKGYISNTPSSVVLEPPVKTERNSAVSMISSGRPIKNATFFLLCNAAASPDATNMASTANAAYTSIKSLFGASIPINY
jgi:hypothetical protein